MLVIWIILLNIQNNNGELIIEGVNGECLRLDQQSLLNILKKESHKFQVELVLINILNNDKIA